MPSVRFDSAGRSGPFPFLDDRGERRVLALVPPRPRDQRLRMMRNWGDAKPVLPRSQWREVSWQPYAGTVLDQDGENACGGYAGASAFRHAWVASGKPERDFSPDYCYCLANN